MNSHKDLKSIACYAVFLLMMLSASFKLFYFGPSVHFYVYPLPNLLLKAVPYLELLGGILFLIGAKNTSFRVYGSFILIPLLFGAVCSHIAFGWFNLWDGVSEPYYFTIPSVSILSLVTWIVIQPIKNLMNTESKVT